MDVADSRYDHKPWNRVAPWGSNEERLVSQALAATDIPHEMIQGIRPPIPRIGMFPEKFGYPTEAFGIRDVVNVETIYPGARVDYAGYNSGRHGSSLLPQNGLF